MAETLYELVIHGTVPDAVVAELRGFEVVSVTDGETTLNGWVVDQSSLLGILDRIGRYGLELTRIAPMPG